MIQVTTEDVRLSDMYSELDQLANEMYPGCITALDQLLLQMLKELKELREVKG